MTHQIGKSKQETLNDAGTAIFEKVIHEKEKSLKNILLATITILICINKFRTIILKLCKIKCKTDSDGNNNRESVHLATAAYSRKTVCVEEDNA